MQDKLDKLAAYARTMGELYFSAREKIAIFKGLANEELRDRLVDSYANYAYDVLAFSLLTDLVRDVWAFALDRDHRAPSIWHLWSEFEKPDVRQAVRARFVDPSHLEWMGGLTSDAERERHMEQARAEYRAGAARAFDEAVGWLDAAVPPLLNSERAKRIATMRKRRIAHYNMTKPEGRAHELFDIKGLRLEWEDPERFLDDAERVVLELAALEGRAGYDVDEFRRMRELQAADFWSRVMGKGPVDGSA